MKMAIVSRFPIFRKGLEALIHSHLPEAEILDSPSVSALEAGYDFIPEVIMLTTSERDNEASLLLQISALRKTFLSASLILIDMEFNRHIRCSAPSFIRAGVAGYITAASDAATMINCIDLVRSGKRYMSVEVLQWVLERIALKGISKTKNKAKVVKLTNNEFVVAKMLSEGLRVSVIAERTGRKVSTISTMKGKIMRKTSTDNIVMLREYLTNDR